MEKTMKIFGREQRTSEGKKFYTYTYTKDGKTFFKVKFKMGCSNIPTGKGYYLITINKEELSLQKFKNHPEWNSVIWIDNIIKCVADEESNNKRSAKMLEEIDNLF